MICGQVSAQSAHVVGGATISPSGSLAGRRRPEAAESVSRRSAQPRRRSGGPELEPRPKRLADRVADDEDLVTAGGVVIGGRARRGRSRRGGVRGASVRSAGARRSCATRSTARSTARTRSWAAAATLVMSTARRPPAQPRVAGIAQLRPRPAQRACRGGSAARRRRTTRSRASAVIPRRSASSGAVGQTGARRA